jgi:hypothetical protein
MGNRSSHHSDTISQPDFRCVRPPRFPLKSSHQSLSTESEDNKPTKDIGASTSSIGIVLEACVINLSISSSPSAKKEASKSSDIIFTDISWKWPKGEIPYEIDDQILRNHAKIHSRILKAIKNYHDMTIIRLVQRKRFDRDWVLFKFHHTDTDSEVGRQGHRQEVNIAPWAKTGNIMHEIMHVLGFHHEQSRSDRSLYVNISEADKDRIEDYEIKGFPLGSYDSDSIMHYGNNDILKAKSWGVGRRIGQRKKFSQGDLKALLYVYSEPQCTYDIFREEYFAQTYYECFTCWGPESDYGVCEYCAIKCHEGHKMVRHDYTELADERMKFLCDCGRNKHEIDVCTKVSTNSKYVKQLMYVCYDCLDVEKYKKMKRGQQRGICNTCVKRCHAEHKTEKIGIIEGACDCGKKNCGAQSIY